MDFKSTAEKDRYYICEIGRLFWGDDKQCYAPDAVYWKVKSLITQKDNQEIHLTKIVAYGRADRCDCEVTGFTVHHKLGCLYYEGGE